MQGCGQTVKLGKEGESLLHLSRNLHGNNPAPGYIQLIFHSHKFVVGTRIACHSACFGPVRLHDCPIATAKGGTAKTNFWWKWSLPIFFFFFLPSIPRVAYVFECIRRCRCALARTLITRVAAPFSLKGGEIHLFPTMINDLARILKQLLLFSRNF